MSKRVIVSVSRRLVWETREEAAEALGVSPVTISRRMASFDPDIRYVHRVWAVRRKDDGLCFVATLDSKDRCYVCVGNPLVRAKKGDVVDVRDITECWYSYGIK